LKLFVEAFAHRGVRLMAVVFLMLQMSFGLYFQLSSYILKTQFGYGSGPMGLFTAYLGIWFAIALLLLYPLFDKRLKIETICGFSYILTGIGLFLTAIAPNDKLIWVFAIIAAGADIIAYSSSITIFSNCADDSKQGWVMGIFASTIAVAWVISGALVNLLPEFGADGLLMIGTALSIIAGILVMSLRSHFHFQSE